MPTYYINPGIVESPEVENYVIILHNEGTEDPKVFFVLVVGKEKDQS